MLLRELELRQSAQLYKIIDELRREYPGWAATKTLDLVIEELGRTQENLLEARARLERRPLPLGATTLLDELTRRARWAGVEDLRIPVPPDQLRYEPLDPAEIGIAVILGVSAVAILVLGLLVAVLHPVTPPMMLSPP